jgi:hypothetical protein
MVMKPAGPAPRLRAPRWLRWLFAGRIRERQQLRMDAKFWALVNDHNWLDYDPTDHRLRFWHRREDQ